MEFFNGQIIYRPYYFWVLNKLRLVPHLRVDYDKGTARLKNSIQIEIMITLIILFLTSILTTSLQLLWEYRTKLYIYHSILWSKFCYILFNK